MKKENHKKYKWMKENRQIIEKKINETKFVFWKDKIYSPSGLICKKKDRKHSLSML